ncbi:hypothetical protein Tco_0545748 [Tanacetum coccineum]
MCVHLFFLDLDFGSCICDEDGVMGFRKEDHQESGNLANDIRKDAICTYGNFSDLVNLFLSRDERFQSALILEKNPRLLGIKGGSVKRRYEDEEQEKTRNRFSLASLLEVNPQTTRYKATHLLNFNLKRKTTDHRLYNAARPVHNLSQRGTPLESNCELRDAPKGTSFTFTNASGQPHLLDEYVHSGYDLSLRSSYWTRRGVGKLHPWEKRTKDGTMYGFRGGPTRVMKGKYVKLTDEFVYPYRNQWCCDGGGMIRGDDVDGCGGVVFAAEWRRKSE